MMFLKIKATDKFAFEKDIICQRLVLFAIILLKLLRK